MDFFGYVSADIAPNPARLDWSSWIPEKWGYYRGPRLMGKIDGVFGKQHVQGWGWRLPAFPEYLGNAIKTESVWRRFGRELNFKNVKIVGLRSEIPVTAFEETTFPKISDGKCLELFWFIHCWNDILQSYGLNRNSGMCIAWEKGNLGLSCARLIAPHIRFLTLLHPRIEILEQAAAVLMAESGVAPKLMAGFSNESKSIKMVIKCGMFGTENNFVIPGNILQLSLFTNESFLCHCPGLSWSYHKTKTSFLLSPEIGEAIVRTIAGLDQDHWSGSNILLERVNYLEQIFRKSSGFI